MPIDDLIAKAEASLDSLEAKPSSPTAIRALLTRLDPKIREAQEKGYGVKEIVDIIAANVADTQADELKAKLTTALETKRKKPSAKRTRTRAKKASP
jgi:hypothetical protein